MLDRERALLLAQLDPHSTATRVAGGDKGGAATGEHVQDQTAGRAGVGDEVLHQVQRASLLG